MSKVRFGSVDVHADTLALAEAEAERRRSSAARGDPESLGLDWQTGRPNSRRLDKVASY